MNIEQYSELAPQFYTGEVAVDLLPLFKKSFQTYLDCGCGDGSLLHGLFSKNILDGKDVHAVDLSENRIALVRQISPNIKARVDSAETLLSVDSDSIDILTSTQVIEHVDDRLMLESVQRVLKSGGTAYIATVFKKRYAWYFYRNEKREWVIDPTHLREYQKDSELLEKVPAGLKLVRQKKEMLWFPLISFIMKRLNLRDRTVYSNKILNILRKIKIPIIGYYNWILVFEKP